MISCTYPGCRDRAVVGLKWSEEVTAGWSMVSDRVFCGYHSDEAVAQLKHRGITVVYTDFGTPVI